MRNRFAVPALLALVACSGVSDEDPPGWRPAEADLWYAPVPKPKAPPPPPPLPPLPDPRVERLLQAAFEKSFVPFLPAVSEILRGEVLQIEPESQADGTGFRGFPIVARKFLSRRDLAILIASLNEPRTYGRHFFGCFAPHHAVRLETRQGKHIELVVCLSCRLVHVATGQSWSAKALTDIGTEDLGRFFDQALPGWDAAH